MFKLTSKRTQKILLISILSINAVLLISFIIYLLLSGNFLPSIFYILAIPVDILSNNILFLVLFFVLNIGTIGYYLFKYRKQSNNEIENSGAEEENEIESFDFSDINSITNDIFEENFSEETIAQNTSQRHFGENLVDLDQVITHDIEESIDQIIDDDLDLTPSYLSELDTNLDETPSIQTNIVDSVASIEVKEVPQKKGINDYQFAFYQMIVNDGWLYEKAADRERIGFDRNALDEAKVSLSDIETLINSGMLYKRTIQHPSGSFTVFSSRLDIEKLIIKETLRRIIRKKRLKFIGRKFDFQSWEEFGLAKKTWEFDIEIADPSILGSIWIDDAFLISSNGKDKNGVTREKKEELKALIASCELKIKDGGKGVIITNNKDNSKIIRKVVQSTGWGEVDILYFSDKNFNQKFLNLLNTD